MLSVLCLSLAPVLRCVTLKRTEFSTLLIPPGVELLFSIALLFKRDGARGKYHYLLCAEGISYFLLALMDFLRPVIPALHQDLFVFKLVDIVLGGFTLAPLLCFTVWFLFVAQQELIQTIPSRQRKPTKYILMSCIPLITITGAIGAFVGISYRTLGDVNVAGFIDERARLLWKISNMISLALLAVYEGMALFLLSSRLMKAIRHKRQRKLIGLTGEIHHSCGIIPINLGMLLSLVETLIGFVDNSFTLGITRRGTKAVGRISIILGLFRGWDYVEDVQFALQQPPKLKRGSKLSIRNLFPNARSSSNRTQTPEHGHERVCVRHPKGRAPVLHLRLSGFDVSPVMRALRSPARSPNSLRTHLIPETTPAMPTVEEVSDGYLDVRYPYHRNVRSDTPASPITPTSPWTVTGPTPRASSSNNRDSGPRSSTPTQNEHLHHPTHTRGDTMSSTMSNLEVEVVTLSESPPDPGFVLPIPSRSRSRQNFNLSPGGSTQTTELGFAEDTPVDPGAGQLVQATPRQHVSPVNEGDVVLSPLDPPRPRRPSWVSEYSDTSSAVISTAARLTRAKTTVSVRSVAVRRTPAAISDDGVRESQQTVVAGNRALANPLPVADHVESVREERGSKDDFVVTSRPL